MNNLLEEKYLNSLFHNLNYLIHLVFLLFGVKISQPKVWNINKINIEASAPKVSLFLQGNCLDITTNISYWNSILLKQKLPLQNLEPNPFFLSLNTTSIGVVISVNPETNSNHQIFFP